MQRTEDRAQSTDRMAGGFSLIETIIVLVVLSIAAVGVLSVFTAGMKGSADPLIVSQALHLAQERMDTIVGDRKNPAKGFGYVVAGNYPNENITLSGMTFSRAVGVVCVDNTDLNADPGPGCPQNYKRVTVTVSWNAGADSVVNTTLFANY